MLANPFEGNLVFKEADTISRVPFTLSELEHLFETAKAKDSEIHDLIVVGACTALRRGDACCLNWADVDLLANRIRVKTKKTGASVPIPIFPRLHAVLRSRPRAGKYVFPGLATAYEEESWVLNNRLRTVFVAGWSCRVTRKDEASLRKPHHDRRRSP
jgi:integrase